MGKRKEVGNIRIKLSAKNMTVNIPLGSRLDLLDILYPKQCPECKTTYPADFPLDINRQGTLFCQVCGTGYTPDMLQ